MNADGQSIASGGNNRYIVGAQLEASLRLAAAAPEMLVALESITNLAFHKGDPDATVESLRSVLTTVDRVARRALAKVEEKS